VLSMWPRKNIFHIQVLVISFFSTPPGTDKTKIGIANRWKSTNSNPPGAIKLSSQ
jgi:hypothetical protein